LLKQAIDAVYIATPPNVHCRQVIQAVRAGKHILCEKPLAITRSEVDRMEKACRQAGLKFMLGFCMRNNVYHKKAKELVQSDALGKIVMGRAQLTCWYPPIPGAWRQDAAVSHGGALIDMGTHCPDILEWIMGARVVEVTGFHDLLVHRRKPGTAGYAGRRPALRPVGGRHLQSDPHPESHQGWLSSACCLKLSTIQRDSSRSGASITSRVMVNVVCPVFLDTSLRPC